MPVMLASEFVTSASISVLMTLPSSVSTMTTLLNSLASMM